MKKLKYHIICILILCSPSINGNAIVDSSGINSFKLDAIGSLSIYNLMHWNNNSFTGMFFYSNTDFTFSKKADNINHLLLSSYELGVSVYVDSTVEKEEDEFSIQYIFKSGKSRISQTINAKYETVFFNSYINDIDQYGKIKRTKTGSAFTPSEIELGFGFGCTFGLNSILNISLTSARFSMMKVNRTTNYNSFHKLAEIGNHQVYFDYGFAGHLYVAEDISKIFSVNCTADFFIKTFRKDEFEMDVSGLAILNFNEMLQLRLNNKIRYAPSKSNRVQLKNELLFGIYFSREQ